jgi:hypothetical protein
MKNFQAFYAYSPVHSGINRPRGFVEVRKDALRFFYDLRGADRRDFRKWLECEASRYDDKAYVSGRMPSYSIERKW